MIFPTLVPSHSVLALAWLVEVKSLKSMKCHMWQLCECGLLGQHVTTVVHCVSVQSGYAMHIFCFF